MNTRKMTDRGLGGHRTINAFVRNKLAALEQMDVSFSSLFTLMFRERDNVMYERSAGYRIVTTTYGQAYDESLRLAGALRERLGDLPPNAVVGLSMDNGPEWIEAFWAILAAGFSPLLINRRLPAPTVERALEDAGAKAVISDGQTYGTNTLLFSSLTADGAFVPGAFGDAIWAMSSGTSDRLKLCAYSAGQIVEQIRESARIVRRCRAIKRHCNGRLKLLDFLPFYHVFGLIAVYLWFGFFSRTFVHLQDMQPATVVNTIRRHGVTHIFAVPLFWETVYRQAMRTVHSRGEKDVRRLRRGLAISRVIGDWPLIGAAFTRLAFRPVREELFGESIRFLITGGGGISREVLGFFNAIGYRLCNGYGMTEIGITSVELSSRKKTRAAGYVGKPLSFAQYRINENGELLVRGRATACRILEGGVQRPAAEWYPTRDLAASRGGRYRILGRRDDVVVAANGENLNPDLIEPYFTMADLAGAALIREDTPDGVRPVLLISVRRTLSADRFAAVDAGVRDTAARLGLTGLLGRIVYVADPLIGEQEFKVNRGKLARRFAAGELRILSPDSFAEESSAADERLIRLRELFSAALGRPPGEIRLDADFFLDEGGTSLDYFALIARLQEEFGVAFPSEGGKGLNTVEGLYAFVQTGGRDGN
ncbi:MAG: AMP-binding protein [Acutalibacteraceae bacterium]